MELKALRLKSGLSQNQLAAKVGVTKQSILNWENNFNEPKYESLIALADALKVTVDEIVGHKTVEEMNYRERMFSELEKYLDKDIVAVLRKKIK